MFAGPQRAEAAAARAPELATRRSIFSRTSAAPCKPLFADATTMPMLADEPRHAETPMAERDVDVAARGERGR